jgi:hypothetical protein
MAKVGQKVGQQVATKNGSDDNIATASAALHEVWPPVVLGLALAINLAWIATLAYGFYSLF